MNYKFPPYSTVFIDPVIKIHGQVGTLVVDNVPEDKAFCDILITTPQTKDSFFRVTGSPKPVDWTMESLSSWLAIHIVQYEHKINK